MEKYYTPALEEFYIGFEYQSCEEPLTDTWETYTIDDGRELQDVIKYDLGDYGERRVKYLDQKDIESLGFEFCFKGKNYIKFSMKEDSYIKHNFYLGDERNITITDHNKDNPENNIIFYGKIKNKSELQRILKDNLEII